MIGDEKPVEMCREKRITEIRFRLYLFIVQNPGLHLSRIATSFHMSSALADYHLTVLEKNNQILSVPDEHGYYKRFFPKYLQVGRKDQRVLSVLRQEPLLKIILLMMTKPCFRQKEIADTLHITPSTLCYHLNKLARLGIIDIVYYGSADKGYSLKQKQEIIEFIQRYNLDRHAKTYFFIRNS